MYKMVLRRSVINPHIIIKINSWAVNVIYIKIPFLKIVTLENVLLIFFNSIFQFKMQVIIWCGKLLTFYKLLLNKLFFLCFKKEIKIEIKKYKMSIARDSPTYKRKQQKPKNS